MLILLVLYLKPFLIIHADNNCIEGNNQFQNNQLLYPGYIKFHKTLTKNSNYDGTFRLELLNRTTGINFVFEPNYNNVDIYTPNGKTVQAYEIVDEFPNWFIEQENNWYNNIYSNAIYISSTTLSYNCHSYAWYKQSSSNSYWIDYPEMYYSVNDQSFYEVNTPRIGDIICYYNIDGENLHSGIVVDYDPTIEINNICENANQVTVISKWGYAGLYEHKGDECPYTAYSPEYSNYNYQYLFASEIKFYRPRTNASYILSNNSPTINEFLIVPTNHQITDEYEMYELNVNYSTDYEIEVSSNYALDVRLYDEHMQLITIDDLNASSNREHFIKTLTNNKRYYLRVAYDDSSQIGTITTSISRHTQHSYDDHYVWTSLTNHKSYCNCGSYINSPHVVSSSAYLSGLPSVPCLLCHGLASVSQIIHQSIEDYPYTPNGSFILPNGVIVLVDEDIEAYLNGTLVFVNGGLMANSDNINIPNHYAIKKKETYLE